MGRCKQCNVEYDDYYDKTELDTEKEYCVLHCDKMSWADLKDKEFKFRYDSFWYEISNIILKNNEKNDLIREHSEAHENLSPYIFEKINFSFFNFKALGNSYYTTYTPDGEDATINEIFDNLEAGIDIIFDDCVFEEEIDFTTKKFSNNIIFKDNCNITKGINFSNNYFTHKVTLKALNTIDVFCNNTSFHKYVDYSKLTMNTLVLENTTFEENVNLLGSTLATPLDLTNSIIKGNINLLNFTCEVANRQTARIIKNEFDKQGDIINANIFYAKEMKMREAELSVRKNFFEWFVFKVHGVSSNHSQDWVLPLLSILTLSFLYSHVECYTIQVKNELNTIPLFLNALLVLLLIFDGKHIEKITFTLGMYLIYSFITKDWYLFNVSNKINPFSIMTGEETLTFFLLIFKIVIAYLIYQLIISIRQNTRRK